MTPSRPNERAPLHADEEGIYEGRCAELCGVFHTVMPTTVEVVSQAEYASHLELISGQDERGPASSPSAARPGTASAPSATGSPGRRPRAARGAERTLVNADALTELLENGLETPDVEAYMPPVGRGWPEFQVQALIEYIRSNERLAPPAAPAQEGQG